MKLSVNCRQISRWLQPNQLVILLLCSLETIQCHSIADAGSESTQDFHTLTPKQPPKSLKVLLVRQQTNPQLELPPVEADTSQVVAQTSTTFTPTASTSANTQHQPQSSTTTTTPSPKQRWIDNILINVEVMNMFNERRRQQQISSESGANHRSEQEAQDESPITVTAFDESQSFQMPTDSGEDLLESQSDTSAAGIEQPAVSAPPFDNSDQKLIESNNVSAILADQSLQPKPPQASSEDNGARIVTMASKQVISCETAYTQCALREVCAPTLKLYNDECQDLLNNRTSECSPKCLRGLIALRSSEAGEDLANCDCQGNEFCQLSKQRSQLCQAQVELALEPTSVVACSVASSICMANQLCSTALGYYYRRCQSLFSQRHCSDRCNNSLTILHKQPQAMKLINCQCDGSEEFPCLKYKTYTERLCLNKQKTPTTPTNESSLEELLAPLDEATGASHLLDNVSDEDDQQEAASASNEDDGPNLTNDPSDLPPTLGQTVGHADDEFGAGPPFDGTDPANANNYFFNGIQQAAAIEDNWIPLVSGRYFTNLHQQQRRQQQQQQLKVKQQQQRKSNTKRAQKNSKQKVRPNETNRKRHARPSMFALTSAATQASHSFVLVAASCLALAVSLLTFP